MTSMIQENGEEIHLNWNLPLFSEIKSMLTGIDYDKVKMHIVESLLKFQKS